MAYHVFAFDDGADVQDARPTPILQIMGGANAALAQALEATVLLDPQLLAQNLALLVQLCSMPNSSLTLLLRDANNNLVPTDVPLGAAGTYQLSVDGTGTPSLVAAPTNNPTRAGSVTLSATDTTKAVVFTTPMPDANYQVVPVMNGLAGLWKPTNQTAAGFTVSVVSAVVGTSGYVATHNA